MSERLPALTAKQVMKIIERHGFVFARQSGSHAIFCHADGRRTTVPIHGKRTLGRGLLRQIMRDANLGMEDMRAKD
jgi:predicted RNA binding protein YcfA (HicA-like mRNA interferase family)